MYNILVYYHTGRRITQYDGYAVEPTIAAFGRRVESLEAAQKLMREFQTLGFITLHVDEKPHTMIPYHSIISVTFEEVANTGKTTKLSA